MFHDDVPIQARFTSWDKQNLLEKNNKTSLGRDGFGVCLEFVRSSFGVRSEFARVRILHDFGLFFGEKKFQSVFLFHVDSFLSFLWKNESISCIGPGLFVLKESCCNIVWRWGRCLHHLFRYWSRCLIFKRFCWWHVRVPKVHPLLIVTLRPHAGFLNIVMLLYGLVLAFGKILFPWIAWNCKYRVFVLMRYVLIQLLLEKDAWHP